MEVKMVYYLNHGDFAIKMDLGCLLLILEIAVLDWIMKREN